jgi:hypothetical protein
MNMSGTGGRGSQGGTQGHETSQGAEGHQDGGSQGDDDRG